MMHETTVVFYINMGIVLFIGSIMRLMPSLTRKSFLFGVKVPEAAHDHPDALRLFRRYRLNCLLATALGVSLSLLQFRLLPELTIVAALYLPLIPLLLVALTYIGNWHLALALKEEHGWHVTSVSIADIDANHYRSAIEGVPWGYYLFSLAAMLTALVVSIARYPELPEMIPTNFGFDMDATVYSPKTMWNVLLGPLLGIVTVAVTALAGVAIVKAKLQLNPENPALSFAQHRVYRRLMGHGIGILSLGMTLLLVVFTLMTIFPGFSVSFEVSMLLTFAPYIPLLVITLRAGQGGNKLNPRVSEHDMILTGALDIVVSESYSKSNDDHHWVLGMFYYNSEDPSLFIEDRFGTNVGFNYARSSVKVAVGLMVFAVVALYLWVTAMLLP